MGIGDTTAVGRIAIALEGIKNSVDPDRIADALEAILAKIAAVEGGEYVEVAKDIGAGHAAIVLTAEELKATVVKLTGAGDTEFNLILSAGVKKLYLVDNQSGQTVTVKLAGSTGTTIATTKRTWLWNDGTDVVPAVVA